MKRHWILWVGLFVLGLSTAAWVVYGVVPRQGRMLEEQQAIGAAETSASFVGNDGEFHHGIYSGGGTQFEASADTGIDDPGDLVVLDAAVLSVVVSGRTGNVGQVVLVERQGAALTLTTLYSEAGTDFGGVAYSPTLQRLYGYEVEVGRILWVPYTAGQTSIGPWTLLADPSTVPELGHADVRWTSRMHVEDGPAPTLVLVSERWWDDIPTVRIQDTTAGPIATVVPPPPSEPVLKIRSHMAPGSTSVEVTGPPGAQVEVVRADVEPPALVGSGTVDGFGVATISTSPLLWGGIYAARSPGGEPQPPFDSPSLLFGAPDPTPIGDMRSLRFMFPAQAAFLGHDHFNVPVTISVDPASVTPPVIYPAILAVGHTGNFTIIPWPSPVNPSRVVLAGPGTVTVGADVRYDEEGIDPIGLVNIPLPNDPSLAGFVLLFQWVIVFSPTDVRVSDVIGYMLRDTVWVPPGSEWLLQPVGTAPSFSQR